MSLGVGLKPFLSALTAYFQARVETEKNQPLELLIKTQNEISTLQMRIQKAEEIRGSVSASCLALMWSDLREKKRLYEALLARDYQLAERATDQD